MATRDYKGRKFEKEITNNTFDSLAIEEPLQININGKPFTVTMRTPGNDTSLVRGLLHSEGVLRDVNFHPEKVPLQRASNDFVTRVDLSIPKEKLINGYANSRSLLSVSSCGICGRTELEDLSSIGMMIDDDAKMEVSLLPEMFQKMKFSICLKSGLVEFRTEIKLSDIYLLNQSKLPQGAYQLKEMCLSMPFTKYFICAHEMIMIIMQLILFLIYFPMGIQPDYMKSW